MNNLICRKFHVKINKKNIDDTKTIGNFGSEKAGLAVYMKHTRILIFLSFLLLCFLTWRCANPVAPEGGPKDTKPPKVLKSDPPNFTTNFKDQNIRIDFNEFIAIKNQAAELNVSPPLKHPPDIKIRGKSLVIKIEDTLATNTTYSIDFGKSISDITENNIFTGFSYVFSTGPYIDSLSLRGSVVNAFDLSPQKDVFAMLYIDCYDTIVLDSLPLKVKPFYITKTDEKGRFTFHNLKASLMKLTALADQNGNLIFEPGAEKIAFSDSIVHPYYIPKPSADTIKIKKDSLKPPTDTTKVRNVKLIAASGISKVKIDSTNKDTLSQKPVFTDYQLFLFDDIDSVQRLQKYTVLKKGLALLVFRFPLKSYSMKTLRGDSTRPWALREFTPHRDTLYLWLTDPAMDSIIFSISEGSRVLDTVRLDVSSKENTSKKKDLVKNYLITSDNTYSSNLNQFAGNYILTFSQPLAKADFSRICLTQDKDTLKPKIYFTDSLKRMMVIENKWKEDKSYSLFIPDSVFTGINGFANDTIKRKFKTRQSREFGNLIIDIDISKRQGDYLIQLLNDKDVFLAEKKIRTNGKVRFENLNPGKFKVKAVYDRNHNGKWDTGNFRKKIQPEEVMFLPKVLEIRANWDVEEKWAP